MKNIVVFASGSGTNFQSIIDASRQRSYPGKITGLVTNSSTAGAIDRAEAADIPHRVIDSASYNTQNSYCEALLDQLIKWNTDLIVLAGYIKKIPDCIIHAYPEKILNIHPSLLPKYGGRGFYGMRVHQAVIDSGDKTSGCTVHIVNEEFDDGPILDQVTVNVYPDDTASDLASRILKQEHILYPEVISNYLKKI